MVLLLVVLLMAAVPITPSRLEAKVAGGLPEAYYGISAEWDGHDSIYLFGGLVDNKASSKIYRYNVLNETVTHVIDFPKEGRGFGSTGRDAEGNLFYFGGYNPVSKTKKSEVFRLSNSGEIEEIMKLPRPTSHQSGATNADGLSYIIGGSKSDEVLEVNTHARSTRVLGILPMQKSSSASIISNSMIYTFTGSTTRGMFSNEVVEFSLLNGLSRTLNISMPFYLSHASAVVVKGMAYVISGLRNNQGPHDTTRIDLANQWAELVQIGGFAGKQLVGASSVYIPHTNYIYVFGGIANWRIYKIKVD